MARTPQACPTICIFDRDNQQIVRDVENSGDYKNWTSNVFSFAIPIPAHRQGQSETCIEFYYTDEELRTPDLAGRRLFLSSEFHPRSNRHKTEKQLNVRNSVPQGTTKIVDMEVYNDQDENVALSKADFAKNIAAASGSFSQINFDHFRAIFGIIDRIIEETRERVDLAFGDFEDFERHLASLDTPQQFAACVDAAIRTCKLASLFFAAATIRFYERDLIDMPADRRSRVRAIRELLSDQFTQPSLATVTKLAERCQYLLDKESPPELLGLRAALTENQHLGELGELLDHLERVFPPDIRSVRTTNRPAISRPLLSYFFVQLGSFESSLGDLVERAEEEGSLAGLAASTWLAALMRLRDRLAPAFAVSFRVRSILRVLTNSNEFVVQHITYRDGHVTSQELTETIEDLEADHHEQYELLLNQGTALELYPFLSIKDHRLHHYNRRRAAGFEYQSAFGLAGSILPTRRRFNQAALRTAIVPDLQSLFWTEVEPSIGPSGITANIPTQRLGTFIGRKRQLRDLDEEVLQITNRDCIIFGPGGVGKTALLIQLSRQLYEETDPEKKSFDDIIWVSAKRDYYDPTLDTIERGTRQFKSLDNVLAAILAFHEFEDPDSYDLAAKKWFVLELLRERRTFLIVDNFESVPAAGQDEIIRFISRDVKRELRRQPEYFKAIITSREAVASGFHQIPLEGLGLRDARLLMRSLFGAYRQSAPPLTDAQQEQLHKATHGIPLIIKHCFGQLFEYHRPFDDVVSKLVASGNAVVDFSFAEIFSLLRQDDTYLRIIQLLELRENPLLPRQIGDILKIDEVRLAQCLATLASYLCVVRINATRGEKYAINDDVRLLSRRLVLEHADSANKIQRTLAALPLEQRIDYTKEEAEALSLFLGYRDQGQAAIAEDFINDQLRNYPDSVLLNLHYAEFLKEVKRQPAEAIRRLEAIRTRSANDPLVLQLLVDCYLMLDPPGFEQAHPLIRALESLNSDRPENRLKLAEFYARWSSAIKMQFDRDPFKEMWRQSEYKHLADTALKLLRGLNSETHDYYYLLAVSHYNKWESREAEKHCNRAIALQPKGHLQADSYLRLRHEIQKKIAEEEQRRRQRKNHR